MNVSALYAQYHEIRKAAKLRLKATLKAQAVVSVVKVVEQLKQTDARTGWRLKRLLRMRDQESKSYEGAELQGRGVHGPGGERRGEGARRN